MCESKKINKCKDEHNGSNEREWFCGLLLRRENYIAPKYNYRSSLGGTVFVGIRLRQDIRRPKGHVQRKSFSQLRIRYFEIFFGILLIKCKYERLYI